MKIKLLIVAGLFAFLAVGCNEDEELNACRDSIDKVFQTPISETDIWINKNLGIPYNVNVTYRWDDDENNYGKNLVPPYEKNVVPFLTILKKLFIDAYIEQAGEEFAKKMLPKQYILVGSESYNPNDGTVTQGTAEGGRKVVLYGINDMKTPKRLLRIIHVIHHEFGHILHQTKPFSEDYQKITKSGYTSTWFNTKKLKDALDKGFISPYAQSNPDDDFVEMLSYYITLTEKEWNDRLSVITEESGKRALAQKLEILRFYLKDQWKIDLDKFRDDLSSEIQKEMKNL